MSGDALPAVSTTAIGVAMIRAAESERPDRLFSDPFAADFVDAADWSTPSVTIESQRERIAALVMWIVVRTRFLDDVVLDGCRSGCRQVVILGAGLDSRAFRLGLARDVRVYEIDLAGILVFKQDVVAMHGHVASCERIVVPADLTRDWGVALDDAGFDATVPTVWLAEGLLVYLTSEQNDALIDAVSARSAVGSRFGLTVTSRDGPPLGYEVLDHETLFRSASPGDAATWLGPRGWTVDVYDATERAHAYGRTDVPTTGARRRGRLVDARREPGT